MMLGRHITLDDMESVVSIIHVYDYDFTQHI